MIYVPYPDFVSSSAVLDDATLADQIPEILRVLDHCHNEQASVYVNRSLLRIWQGHEPSLAHYGLVCLETFESRATPQGWMKRPMAALSWHLECATSGEFSMEPPAWFGNLELHESHQSLLMQVDPDFYTPKFCANPLKHLVWPDGSEQG